MRVFDLFCGAGGFSTGFAEAGFDVVLGVDNWPAVEATFLANHPGADFLLADVGDLDPRDLPRVDVVIGSPPCPEFSTANKARNPERGMVLVREYERVVSALRPRWFVMENVPPVQPFLSPVVYPRIRVLNAADYGVPQIRRRCLAGRYPLPRPTHARVPSSTLDGREVLPWVSVREAIGALIVDVGHAGHQSGLVRDGEPAFTLRTRSDTAFAVEEDPLQLTLEGALAAARERGLWLKPEQVARVMAFRRGQTDDAARPSRTIKAADVGRMNDSMYLTGKDVESLGGARRPWVPPAPSAVRLAEGRPASTIAEPYLMDPRRKRTVFGTARPTGQNERRLRRLTLREAARLQSFPDSFRFLGSKTARYTMVGNAVPPLLARRVAEGILREEGGQTRLGRWGA